MHRIVNPRGGHRWSAPRSMALRGRLLSAQTKTNVTVEIRVCTRGSQKITIQCTRGSAAGGAASPRVRAPRPALSLFSRAAEEQE